VSRPPDLLLADLPEGVVGGFSTRHGGVSDPPWDELNLALHVEDDSQRVLANRLALAQRLGATDLLLPHQVHGAQVFVVDASRKSPERFAAAGPPEADALVTTQPTAPLGVLVADCLPVLMADTGNRVVGAAHVGRRGLVGGVLQATINAMVVAGTRPADIVAVIGPGACGRCYEVPERMRDEVDAIVPGSASTTRAGTPGLDLAAGAEHILAGAGIGTVRQTGICTIEDARFYSYRRDGRTGRFAGVIMLAGRD
jgi:polyphenol oxidase